MRRAIFFVLISVALFNALNCAAIESQRTFDAELIVVDDINAYLEQNPDVEILQKLDRTETRGQIRHSIGEHVLGM